MVAEFIRYKLFGPRLYKEYGTQKLYEANTLERWGDQILSTLNVCWSISMYASPIILMFAYRRQYFTNEGLPVIAKLGTGVAAIVFISFLLRGFGRSTNETYQKFAKIFQKASSSGGNEEALRAMRKYDFDFSDFPVDFTAGPCEVSKKEQTTRNSTVSAPCRILAYLAIHTFGIKLIYPGSIRAVQNLVLAPMLLQGRSKLVEEEEATRYKLKTCDNNEIDSIFVDNRAKHVNGKTLVLCSEGNAGFYEFGIMSTPLALKYSVLGWNHPGFCGSTGTPYPSQDKNAVNAVMEFALKKLNFDVKDIILNGWSIGAFSTLTLATKYDVKACILDATFDDILPLAIPRMPEFFSSVVRIAIREYVNLHNSELIKQYKGPVLLVRRTEDEIIATEEGDLSSNRGNNLLIALLKFRFPTLFEAEQQQKHALNILSKHLDNSSLTAANERLCEQLFQSYFERRDRSYPVYIGESLEEEDKNQLVLYLIKKHLVDFKSTHCTPLPTEYFRPDTLFDISKYK
ncbi:phosphatidylserine lipase ABHD16A [Culicoides brevitarsis]|uniref:phosphatidylserine lipase ABHD16A n=1 Tax=Culicoides brevitarsis TaxID=469753 RepID=UPI00307C73C0